EMGWRMRPSASVSNGADRDEDTNMVLAKRAKVAIRSVRIIMRPNETQAQRPSTLRIGARIDQKLTTKCWVGWSAWLGGGPLRDPIVVGSALLVRRDGLRRCGTTR